MRKNSKDFERNLINHIRCFLQGLDQDRFIIAFNKVYPDNPIIDVWDYINNIIPTLRPYEAFRQGSSGFFSTTDYYCIKLRSHHGLMQSSKDPKALVNIQTFATQIYKDLAGEPENIFSYLATL